MTLREVGDRLLDVDAMVAIGPIGAHMVTTVICLAGLDLQAVEDKKTDEVAEQLSVGFYDNVRKGSSARLRMGNCQEGGVRTHDVGVPTPESRGDPGKAHMRLGLEAQPFISVSRSQSST
ncbi:hypothetical protein E4U10_008225 [Claviceps purpurea]|nr:hypothetical protein E4U10_008225 [Claviceps purpurea]KAG6200737.1 hypothetical protein E4U50_006956 [Claviceps purpurea]